MDKKNVAPDPRSDPDDLRIVQWLAEAGITVDLVEDTSGDCSVCSPPQLDVAA